jgi:hypothetical protein
VEAGDECSDVADGAFGAILGGDQHGLGAGLVGKIGIDVVEPLAFGEARPRRR